MSTRLRRHCARGGFGGAELHQGDPEQLGCGAVRGGHRHADRPIVGALASLGVEPSVLAYAEKAGLVVLGIGDQMMKVKNRPSFVPRRRR
jgi:hypothetical protein